MQNNIKVDMNDSRTFIFYFILYSLYWNVSNT